MESKLDLTCNFVALHTGMDRQKSKPRKLGDAPLHPIGVTDRLSQHLKTATNAHHQRPFTVGTDYGLRHAVATEFVEVVERGFRSWQYHYVRLLNIICVIGVEEIHTLVAFKNSEVYKDLLQASKDEEFNMTPISNPSKWIYIQESIDSIYPNFTERLCKLCPSLSDKDLQV